MNSVGIFEAGAHLAQLLERVARGERIVLTDDGIAVAVLAPPEAVDRADPQEVGRAMLEYRDQARRALGGSFRDLAHEGHGH